MSSSSEHVLARVRDQILKGERAPGDKISEVAVAAELDVSRTPARTALAALAAEGLIEKRDGRGYTVRAISSADVAQAIEVRSVLEGLAARTLAANGMPPDVEEALVQSIGMSQSILERDDAKADVLGGYSTANRLFHETILFRCGNDLIAHTYERIAMLPLAALGALAFDRASFRRQRMRLTVGHSQHVIIFDALKKRDSARAEVMMREHSMATLNYRDLFVTTGAGALP